MSRNAWRETSATVYTCGVDTSIFGALNPSRIVDISLYRTFLFSTRYLVVFSYAVDGEHFSGEFISPTEWKEGSIFPLKYDPKAPERNDRSVSSAARWAGVAIGVWMGLALVVGRYLQLHFPRPH
jgi:hypothetical protein